MQGNDLISQNELPIIDENNQPVTPRSQLVNLEKGETGMISINQPNSSLKEIGENSNVKQDLNIIEKTFSNLRRSSQASIDMDNESEENHFDAYKSELAIENNNDGGSGGSKIFPT